MSKRLKAALIMMTAILLLCLFSTVSTAMIADRVIDKAKQLQNGTADMQTLELFEEQWEKYEKLLSLYTRHSELENISESVHILDALIKEDEQLFRIECNRIIAAAHHMKNTEMPYLRNIF